MDGTLICNYEGEMLEYILLSPEPASSFLLGNPLIASIGHH